MLEACIKNLKKVLYIDNINYYCVIPPYESNKQTNKYQCVYVPTIGKKYLENNIYCNETNKFQGTNLMNNHIVLIT